MQHAQTKFTLINQFAILPRRDIPIKIPPASKAGGNGDIQDFY
jgi:hypothetical protein